ncbi:bifunctional phosphoglucose/phosphomannose isomerase [Candidatus Woesearchaeota archaeon]|nr:bifunctional phosphoglucose/phosphomannose isomerase [Candidatus Woesearchaeota archaeon]
MISKEEIQAVDKFNMIGSIATLQKQVSEGLKLAEGVRVLDEINDIVISGMGGSCLQGEILKSLFSGSKLKITLSRDYKIPEWANKRTLVFAVSYSGNTEESISSFRDAVKKSCQIVAMASGGKLEELAKKNKVQFIKLPKPFEGFQPRAGIGYLFFATLGVLMNSRIVPDMTRDIEKTVKALRDVKYKDNAMDLAEQLEGKIPIIYTSEKLAGAGYKWKIAFNENAKTHAFFNVYPEQNHNEINAFVNIKGDFHVIMLSNDDDHKQVRKRMKITKELYKKKGVNVTEIAVTGDSLLTKLFSAMMIGDLVAYFLAIKYKTDPTPVEMVENLKKEL